MRDWVASNYASRLFALWSEEDPGIDGIEIVVQPPARPTPKPLAGAPLNGGVGETAAAETLARDSLMRESQAGAQLNGMAAARAEAARGEENTSELQSLNSISYSVFLGNTRFLNFRTTLFPNRGLSVFGWPLSALWSRADPGIDGIEIVVQPPARPTPKPLAGAPLNGGVGETAAAETLARDSLMRESQAGAQLNGMAAARAEAA